MNNEIITSLSAVIQALDSIAVVGQHNRGNLYGSIETLKDIVQKLSAESQTRNADIYTIPAAQATGEE